MKDRASGGGGERDSEMRGEHEDRASGGEEAREVAMKDREEGDGHEK